MECCGTDEGESGTDHSNNGPMKQPAKKMPKRRRVLSRRLQKHAPNQKARRVDLDSSSSVSQPQVVLPPPTSNAIQRSLFASSTGPQGRYTSAQYKAELKSVTGENSQLKNQLDIANKKLSVAESKIAQLVETNRVSLSKVRESKGVAKSAEMQLHTQSKLLKLQLQEHELNISKHLEEAKLKYKVTSLLFSSECICMLIDLTSPYLTSQDHYDRGIMAERKKASRNISTAKTKHAKEISTIVARHKKMEASKDKTIKVMGACSVSTYQYHN